MSNRHPGAALAAVAILVAAAVCGGCWPFGGSGAKRAAGARPPAAAAPSGVRPPAVSILSSSDDGRLTASTLKPLGPPRGNEPKTPAEIVAALSSERAGERIRGLVAAARTRPPEARATLARMARRDGAFAPAAVEVLALYPDPAGARELLAALDSPQNEARAAAARELGARGIPAGGDAEKKLARMVRRDRHWLARAAAARGLGLGAAGNYGLAGGKALEAALADSEENELVRLESAAALARTPGNRSGWDYLSEAAGDRAGDRAIRALELAGELGGGRGAAILGSALASDRPELWTNAVRCFELVGREAALEALAARLRAGGESGRSAALALAPFEGERLAPELVRAMEEGSPPLRAAACAALARAAGAAAAPALERKLLAGSEPSHVRSAAAAALGSVGGPGAAVTLRAVMTGDSDPVARAAARNALELLQARLEKAGPVADPAELERLALRRWTLLGVEPGGAAKFRDSGGEVKLCRPGDELALGYVLARVLGPGEEPTAPEALLAGPEAAEREMLRAIFAKGHRAAVLAAPGIRQ